MAVIAELAVIVIPADSPMDATRFLTLVTVRTDKNGIIGWSFMAFRTGYACMVAGQGQGMVEDCLVPGDIAVMVATVTRCGIAGCLVVRVPGPFIVSLMTAKADCAFARCIDPVLVAVRAGQGLVDTPKRPGVVPYGALP
jgi:hypothetical protein